MRKRPGKEAVFEELIHATQYRLGRNDGTPISKVKCEIEAQEKLLKYQKAYKLTKAEVEMTKINLKGYFKELQEWVKKG